MKMQVLTDARTDPRRLNVKSRMKILQSADENGIVTRIPVYAVTKNISSGGLCFRTGRKMRPGLVLEADIYLDTPGCVSKIKAFCRIAWFRASSEPGRYETGLQFMGMKDTHKKCLNDFLSRDAA